MDLFNRKKRKNKKINKEIRAHVNRSAMAVYRAVDELQEEQLQMNKEKKMNLLKRKTKILEPKEEKIN